MAKQTPADVLAHQMATVEEAIASLQAALDRVTGTVDPEAVTWADTAILAQVFDDLRRTQIVTGDPPMAAKAA